MWVLIFVVATSSNVHSTPVSVVQEFSSKDSCMSAQTSLIKQSASRGTFVLVNTCNLK